MAARFVEALSMKPMTMTPTSHLRVISILNKVKAFVDKVGVENVGFFIMTLTNNPGGGQPCFSGKSEGDQRLCQEHW